MTIEIKYENEEGVEITLSLPSRKEVCSDCEGEGYVLCEGMRGYAYSLEEFEESFDEEEREEYFKRGGQYDQVCPSCKGANVIDVIDEEKIPSVQKEEYAKYQAYAEEVAKYEAESRAERNAERRFGC